MIQPRARRPTSLQLWNCRGRKQTWCSGCQREGSAAEWTWPVSCWKDKHEPPGEREEGKKLRNPAAEPCATPKIYYFSWSNRLQNGWGFQTWWHHKMWHFYFQQLHWRYFFLPALFFPSHQRSFFHLHKLNHHLAMSLFAWDFWKLQLLGEKWYV